MQDAHKPAATLTVTVDGEEREIKMTYGLQDKLITLVRDTSEIGNIFIDPEVRNNILAELLAKRGRGGKIEGERKDAEEYEISMEDIDALLSWATDVVTNFFIRALEILERKLTIPQALDDSQSTASSNGTQP
jgi:hypothetical protein